MASDEALERKIAAQVEEWSSSSTEAFEISLFRGDEEAESFAPDFTYPIFGEEEVIFGYQGLNISLAFASHNLQPHLEVTYDRKWPDQGEIKATDIREPLKDYLPAAAFSEASRSTALFDPQASSFVPPGQKLHTYKRDGQTYEIWCASLDDPKARQILQNMQILVPLFIEGGTILELEHPWIVQRWKIFLMYLVDDDAPQAPNRSKYSIVGYGTSFRTFAFPDKKSESLDAIQARLSEEEIDKIVRQWQKGHSQNGSATSALEMPSRERLSQFVMLPPYQHQGLGTQLYNTMYAELTTQPNVLEFTVEDPNEAFDDMRDVCDMIHLRSHNEDFASLKIASQIPASDLKADHDVPIDSIVDGAARERIRKSSKIMPRQLARLIEMQTLSKIPSGNRSMNRITRRERASNEHDRAFYFWCLLVKQRLREHNLDALKQLEVDEQIEKLNSTIEGIRLSYEKILEMVEHRLAKAANGASNGKPRQKLSRKRKHEDEADEDDENEEAGGETSTKTKKRRPVQVVDEDDDE